MSVRLLSKIPTGNPIHSPLKINKILIGGALAALGIGLCYRLRFGRRIDMSREVFDEFKSWSGKIEYYHHRGKGWFRWHSAIVLRKHDPSLIPFSIDHQNDDHRDDEGDAAKLKLDAVMVHLVLSGMQWVVHVNKTQWRPPRSNSSSRSCTISGTNPINQAVQISEHVWDLGNAVRLLTEAAVDFGPYVYLDNNCRQFSSRVKTHLQKFGGQLNKEYGQEYSMETLIGIAEEKGVILAVVDDGVLKSVVRNIPHDRHGEVRLAKRVKMIFVGACAFGIAFVGVRFALKR